MPCGWVGENLALPSSPVDVVERYRARCLLPGGGERELVAACPPPVVWVRRLSARVLLPPLVGGREITRVVLPPPPCGMISGEKSRAHAVFPRLPECVCEREIGCALRRRRMWCEREIVSLWAAASGGGEMNLDVCVENSSVRLLLRGGCGER